MGTIIFTTTLALTLIIIDRFWFAAKKTRRSKYLLFKGLLY